VHTTASRNKLELSDVRAEIDALIERIVTLRVLENSLIAQQLPINSEIPLRWNEATRMIFWLGGSCRLSPKQFLFVKTLWDGKDHFAEWSDIEETVWAEKIHKKPNQLFVPKNTVSVFLFRLQAKLAKSHFPYTILSVIEKNNQSTSGWCLVITENYKKM
jgi:hypothetical protein